MAYAFAQAELIVSKSPDAIRMGKRLIETAWHQAPAQALQLEAQLQQQIIGKPNQLEAVMAAMQKREAKFSDPRFVIL